MFSLAGVLSYGLKIDGVDMTFDKIQIQSITVRTHIQYSVPTLDFEFTDISMCLEKKPLTDGMLIEISMARLSEDKVKWMPFRVFKIVPASAASAGGKFYTVSCYYDMQDYLFTKKSKVYTKTSDQILQDIAKENKLTPVIDTTSDSSTWRCSNQTTAEFIRKKVVPAAYIGNTSAIITGISPWTKTLFYKDAIESMSSPPVAKLINKIDAKKYDFFINEYHFDNSSGLLNKQSGGYAHQVNFFDVMKGVQSTLSGVSVKKLSANLNLNNDFLGKMSNQSLPTLDLGNVSDSFQKALGQNKRLLGTFSNSLEILVREVTSIDLFDTVDITILTKPNNAEGDTQLSGIYLCIGKATVITTLEYGEKLCLMRNSSNLSTKKLA